MKLRNLILVGITVVCVIVYFLIAAIERRSHTQIATGELFFPNLIDQVFEIGEIRIQSAQNETNIRLVDDVWRVQQQDSYFANIARVQNLIVGMSQLRMLEKKTSVAERFSELGLEGVGIENSQTIEIQLISTQEDVLAELLFGKSKSSNSNPLMSLIYVRKPDQNQTWLTETALDVPTDSLEWIHRNISDFDNNRISEVQLIVPEQANVRVFQPDRDAEKFELADVPEGFQVRHQFLVNNIGRLFRKLNFERVIGVSQWQSSSEIRMKTFDGLFVIVSIGTDSLSQFATFEAKAENGASPEILQEVQQLNRKWSGWAFQLSQVRINSATALYEELIERQEILQNSQMQQ